MTIRLRRSLLYMPASSPRALEKAKTLACDGIIIDLEDAVAAEAKESARAHLVDVLKAGGFGDREVVVRINAIDTPWSAEDLMAMAVAAPDAILLPKISIPDQIEQVGQRLLDMHAAQTIHLWAMIETPLAIFNVRELAAAALDSETRLTTFVVGTNDLARDTGARIVPGRAPMLGWLSTCVLAAHAYGVTVLDGVYNDISDSAGFAKECEQARDLGFDGKTLIHPNQIAACNAAFSPSAAEIEQARAIVAAFARPENQDKGAVQLGGRMVERMHADMAQRTIAIAETIAEREG